MSLDIDKMLDQLNAVGDASDAATDALVELLANLIAIKAGPHIATLFRQQHGLLKAQSGTIKLLESKMAGAMALGFRYGTVAGSDHKMWVIDQMIRVLAGNDYDKLVADSNEGEEGPNTYEWETGVAP